MNNSKEYKITKLELNSNYAQCKITIPILKFTD